MQPDESGGREVSSPEQIPPSLDLGPVVIDVPYRRVVLNAAATWDWFPGHHDPEYARRQGQRTIYLSTVFFHGLVDRAATTWSGPGFRVSEREIRMQRSIYAGQSATVHGRLLRETDGGGLCFEGVVASEEGPCVPFFVTVVLR